LFNATAARLPLENENTSDEAKPIEADWMRDSSGDGAVLAMAQSPAPTTCGAAKDLADGWRIATPESVDLDGARLCRMADQLKATNANFHAVLIVRHGKLVFVQYFAGYDEPWGKPNRL
jgi:hypothetical protein